MKPGLNFCLLSISEHKTIRQCSKEGYKDGEGSRGHDV